MLLATVCVVEQFKDMVLVVACIFFYKGDYERKISHNLLRDFFLAQLFARFFYLFFFILDHSWSQHTIQLFKCTLVRFQIGQKLQAHQDLEVHPSSLALDSQAAWNVGIIGFPLDSNRRLS